MFDNDENDEQLEQLQQMLGGLAQPLNDIA